MVRGNKFKPKPAPAPEPEPTLPVTAEPEAAPASAGAAESVQAQRKKKRSKSKQGQGAGQPATSGPASNGTAAAAAAAAVGGASGSKPPKKKRKVMNGSAAAAGGAATAAAPGKATAAQPAKAGPAAAAPIIPTLVAPVPPKPGAAGAVGSNWAALKSALAAQQAQQQGRGKPRGRPGGKRKGGRAGEEDDAVQDAKPQEGKLPQSMGSEQGLTKVLAIDCEMVGVGPNGSRSVLARVCIVNSAGNVLLDTHVKPKEPVTDYRTKVSGVRPSHLHGAPDFSSVQKRVVDALRGRVVVGHALTNDLKVLLLSHPRKDIRDTSRYPPLMQSQGSKRRPKSLRQLAQEELGLVIQAGEHNPVDDARAALYLYLKHRKEWERWLAQGGKPPRTEPHQPPKKKLKSAGAALQQQQQQLSCVPRMKQTLEQLAANDYMADL